MKWAILSFQSLLVLVLAIASGHSLVSARDELRPTQAPLLSSTVKPTSAPKAESKPTKPLMIINAPPMKQKHLLKSSLQVQEAKPLQVTGFITKSGDIYEIEDKRGLGRIEPRQADDADEPQIVCNYGNVVIYSDVPCDQVTKVKVGEVQPLNGPSEQQQSQSSTEGPLAADEDDSQQAAAQPLAGDGSNVPRQQNMQQRRRRRRPQKQQQQQIRRRQGSNAVRLVRRRNRNGNANRNGNRRGQQRQMQRRRIQQQQQQRR
ncbi:PREDICTED: uncharacterized protein LOC108618065, partial [Drosophila arizonae]|uniref:Uncharacterized protein LOC108618065 n=1 Tax=Drosophila arizonae TaxID=7263 RepID=A0ABM1PQH5_DROAR